MLDLDGYIENDTQPTLNVTFAGVDVSLYSVLELHIAYAPYVRKISAVKDVADNTKFYFPWLSRVVGFLAAATAIGDTTASVTITSPQTFTDLPASGEIDIDGERVLYSSKTAPATLHLASPLAKKHLSGVAVEKLPDLRTGQWPCEIEVVDATGERLTFSGLLLQVTAEIA